MKCFANRKVLIVSLIAWIFIVYLPFILQSCKKLEFEKVVRVITGEVTDITENSATLTGIIQDVGEKGITQCGHCWSIYENPTISGSHTTNNNGVGSFTSNITGLSAYTKYYARAYATSSGETVYGSQISFTTLIYVGLPTVVTSSVSNITNNSATCGGNVISDGGATVTAKGVCWSTSENPTVSDNHTTDGSGTGPFTSNLTELSPDTTYYVRAYATNIAGTTYGTQRSFSTPSQEITLPVVITDTISSITDTSAQSGGNVTSDGGAEVTARGVCWDVSENPDLSDDYTTDGNGTGKFTSSITELSPGITYYVRAYATNSVGTVYGDQISFKTWSGSITDYNGNVYWTIKIGDQIWMAENLKTTRYNDGTDIPLVTDNTEWANLYGPAYCWYNNDEAQYKNTYGAIYTWYTVNTDKLCPAGWHVPSDDEWTTLTDYLGGESVAGGKLKEAGTTHWDSPNTGATNETGFTALPGGTRAGGLGDFGGINTYGYWWSSTEYDETRVWWRNTQHHSSRVDRNYLSKWNGYSVRCLKD